MRCCRSADSASANGLPGTPARKSGWDGTDFGNRCRGPGTRESSVDNEAPRIGEALPIPTSASSAEIEVAALVGLENVLVVEPVVAAADGRGSGRHRGAATLELGGIDEQVELLVADAQGYPVAIPHERERTAARGIRGDVQ